MNIPAPTDSKEALQFALLLAAGIFLCSIFLWLCFPVFAGLLSAWREPDYQHGFFVPVFAGALLWRRRELIEPLPKGGSWWAMAIFAVWAPLWLFSTYLVIPRFLEWSIIVFATGVTVFLGGWRALRWAWPSIVFLVFMFPLPGAVQGRLSFFLQQIGTKASVYAIQTLGIPAVPLGVDGNIIQLPEAQLGVVEACSGIRMLMLFFAICVGAAFWLRCPLWKKAVIVISAIPIAVFSNVTRITVTAILYEMARKYPAYISEKAAERVFHDFAGWLMMPLGLVLLLGVWTLLEKLIIDRVPEGPLVLGSPIPMKPVAADSHSTNNP